MNNFQIYYWTNTLNELLLTSSEVLVRSAWFEKTFNQYVLHAQNNYIILYSLSVQVDFHYFKT